MHSPGINAVISLEDRVKAQSKKHFRVLRADIVYRQISAVIAESIINSGRSFMC